MPGEIQVGYLGKFLLRKRDKTLEQLSREIVESSFLKVIKKHVDVALRVKLV